MSMVIFVSIFVNINDFRVEGGGVGVLLNEPLNLLEAQKARPG